MPIRSQDVYSVLWLCNLITKITFLKENFYLLQWENIVKIFFFLHSRFTSLYNELHVVAYLSTLNSLAVSDIFLLLLFRSAVGIVVSSYSLQKPNANGDLFRQRGITANRYR